MPRHSVTMIEASGNVFRQPTDPGILLDEGKRQPTYVAGSCYSLPFLFLFSPTMLSDDAGGSVQEEGN